MPVLVPSLVVLRATFNDLYPYRDRRSDGWIGDLAHQARHSDHNPDGLGNVHAIDIDTDLGDGGRLGDYVDFIVNRCASGAEKRLTYVIYDRQIASATHEWVWRNYTATKDPHIGHAHFSASHEPKRENDKSSWHLEDVPMPLTTEDKRWILETIKAATKDTVAELLRTQLAFPYDSAPGSKRTIGDLLRYIPSRDVIANAVDEKLAPRFEKK